MFSKDLATSVSLAGFVTGSEEGQLLAGTTLRCQELKEPRN